MISAKHRNIFGKKRNFQSYISHSFQTTNHTKASLRQVERPVRKGNKLKMQKVIGVFLCIKISNSSVVNTSNFYLGNCINRQQRFLGKLPCTSFTVFINVNFCDVVILY